MPENKKSFGARIFDFLASLFREHDAFYVARPGQPLPACTVRMVGPEDYADCEEIYRLNEALHFPTGYFERFSRSLRGDNALYLVAVADGKVCGLGGIARVQARGADVAGLMFGMVHPQVKRQGYGTVLLLSRLALLSPPRKVWFITLSTIGGSESFYGRFGFTFARVQKTADGVEHRHYYAKINGHRVTCRLALKEAGVVLDAHEVAKLPTMIPDKMREENALAGAST